MSPQESVGYYRELGYWYSAPKIRNALLTLSSCSWLRVVQVPNRDLVRKNWDSKPPIPLDQHEQTPEILYLIADCSVGILRKSPSTVRTNRMARHRIPARVRSIIQSPFLVIVTSIVRGQHSVKTFR